MTAPALTAFTEASARTVTFVKREPITADMLLYSPAKDELDPRAFTLELARGAIGLPQEFAHELSINRRLYYGDHWLDGEGWKGIFPQVQPGATLDEATGVQELWMEIRRGFNPRNVIAETNERHTTGVVGNEPRWTWTPDGVRVRTPRQLRKPAVALLPPPLPKATATDPNPTPDPAPTPAPGDPTSPDNAAATALMAKIDQLNSQLTKWWDDRNCHDVFLRYTTAQLYGRVVSLRVHIAASAIEQERVTGTDGASRPTGRRVLRVKDVDDALSKIHVEVVDADQGRVVRDRATLADVGVRMAKRGNADIAHVTYLDDTGRTVMAVVDQSSGGGQGQTPAAGLSFDLGGRLLMHTSIRDTFCTEQVRQGQFALNYANTVIGRNLTTSGFLRTTYANVALDGEFKTINGRRRFIPDPILSGPTVETVLQGHKIDTPDGGETMTTPTIHDRAPIDPTPTIAAKREYYRDILEECDQVHVLISGDAVTSGVSRVQARADHVSSMKLTQANNQRAGRWLIETVTAFAHALANPQGNGGADVVRGMRVEFQCLLDPGPTDAAERAQNTTDVGAGTLSVETCIERNSITDVDAEVDRIESARAVDLEVKRAAIFASWIAAGADETFAAYRAGLSPAEIARLQEGFTVPAPPPIVDPNANPNNPPNNPNNPAVNNPPNNPPNPAANNPAGGGTNGRPAPAAAGAGA